jgi:2-oxoglutarate ferredoxin oxidoreductase subunit beta
VARGFSGDIPQLSKLVAQAISHKGFSVLDVLQPCVTFNHMMTQQWYKERVYYLPPSYKPNNRVAAYEKALEFPDVLDGNTVSQKIPLGIFYKTERPTYEDSLIQIKSKPLASQKFQNIDIHGLVAELG